MQQNFKFHAIAVLSICAIITAVYFVMTPPPPPPAAAADTNNGRSIQIYNATWGENCNPTIDEALATRATTAPQKDENGALITPPKIEHAKHDNVLSVVSGVCKGHVTCELTPTSENLKIEPMESCYKSLVVGYRCTSFEPLSTFTVEQAKTSTIDCSKHETPAPAGK